MKQLAALILSACIALLLAPTAIAQSGSYDWSNAGNLHPSYPGILRAYLATNSPRLMKINCLRIDLRQTGLRLFTTGRIAGWQDGVQETLTKRTRDFISESQATSKKVLAAINAQPFVLTDANSSVPTDLDYGLAISEGIKVSSFVTSGNITPLFSVNHQGVAEIVMKGSGSGYDLSSTRTAVSGFSRPLNKGATAGDTVTLHPRTGIGLSTNGQYAYFMTVDGRASEWSEGATEREVGEWLQFFGAYNGLNMDGGGSTTMAWWNPAGSGSSDLLNVPRDNSTSSGNPPAAEERYVGSSIGVYYTTEPVMQVYGNSQIISDGTNAPLSTNNTDFGNAPAMLGTVVKTFTIVNAGGASLNLTGTPRVALSGAAAGDFTVNSQPSSPVAVGGTNTFQITFAPQAVGVRSATVSITSDDTSSSPYTFNIQGTGLNDVVVWWKFDESSGTTAADSSGKTNAGTLSGLSATPWTAGKIGNALTFNGAGTVTKAPMTVTNAGECSISLWMKTSGASGAVQWLIDHADAGTGAGLNICIAAFTGNVIMSPNGGLTTQLNTTNSVTDNNWHHVAVTRASSSPYTFKIYVDGVLKATDSAANNTLPALGRLFAGAKKGANTYYSGQLDDVRVYGRVLSDTEIQALANSAVQPTLTITRQRTQVEISWTPAGGSLESSPVLGPGADWTTVGTDNPAQLGTTGSARYFRVVNP